MKAGHSGVTGSLPDDVREGKAHEDALTTNLEGARCGGGVRFEVPAKSLDVGSPER